MAEILEVIMIVSFGVSWPLNVVKSYKAGTVKGKSLGFLCLIFFGYIAGILSKFFGVFFFQMVCALFLFSQLNHGWCRFVHLCQKL